MKWLRRRQLTVETIAFSSEFIALKQCIEDVEHLRFKVRMFGIPIYEDEPTHILCDNNSVVTNNSNVEASLNKKHSSIAYPFSRWNVATGVCQVAWVPTDQNIADAITKRLSKDVRDYGTHSKTTNLTHLCSNGWPTKAKTVSSIFHITMILSLHHHHDLRLLP